MKYLSNVSSTQFISLTHNLMSSCHSQLLPCTITGLWAPNSACPNRLNQEFFHQHSRGVCHYLYLREIVDVGKAQMYIGDLIHGLFLMFQMHYILQCHWIRLCRPARREPMCLYEWTSRCKNLCWQVQHGLLGWWRLLLWRWLDNGCPPKPALPLI